MYSSEINQVLESQNYNIDSDTYSNICKESPQIVRIKYDRYGQYYEMWTNDNHYWKFNVYRKE